MHSPAETGSVRRALYVLFARLFAGPPDAALYSRLRTGGLDDLAAAQGLDLTSDLLEESDPEGSAAELEAEYESLCAGVSLRAGDYPAATEDPSAAVRAFLKEHAMALQDGINLPPDHISVVLGIMGELTGQAERALQQEGPNAARIPMQRARAFLLRHVLSWAQGALAEVAARADRHFYKSLAAMASAFLESERRLFESA